MACLPHDMGTASEEVAETDLSVSLAPFHVPCDQAGSSTCLHSWEGRRLVFRLSRAPVSSFKPELPEVRVYVFPSSREFLKGGGCGTSSPKCFLGKDGLAGERATIRQSLPALRSKTELHSDLPASGNQ